MSKQRTLLLAGISMLATAGIVTGLIFMVKHEPNFYSRADVPAGKDRQDKSSECLNQFFNLFTKWVDAKGEWDVTFSERQINSYFEEDFIPHGLAEVLRKRGITEPRIVLEDDKLRLAFRYGSGAWSTIISYDLRFWLAKDENVLCVEVLGGHAGALPISTQSLLNDITEVTSRGLGAKSEGGVEVTWYRQKGNAVAVVRLQCNSARASAQLKHLVIKQGLLDIGGVSKEPYGSNEKNALAPLGN